MPPNAIGISTALGSTFLRQEKRRKRIELIRLHRMHVCSLCVLGPT